VSFDNFDSSDAAIEAMNSQYFGSKEISVQYAFKKDGKGERHGDQAERMLASQAKKHNVQVPVQPQLFAQPGVPPMGDGGQMANPLTAPGFAPGRASNPLAPPPNGLPARPPPSLSGFNPPAGFMPPGFAPPGFAPGFAPPQGYPPGFTGQGAPPNLPPGFQYGNR
jgi:splicing factor 3B subunit 4